MAVNYKNANILIVDDDEDDFIITSEYIRSISGNTFQIKWSPSYKDGISKLEDNPYDLYFVDYRLGAKSGVDFLKEAQLKGCESPIVLLTGKGNYTVDIQAMEYGAVDYLVKTELNVEKMERCIRYALDRAATLQALKANERKYRTIFEKSKDVVFVTDAQLNFIDVNNAIKNLLGYPAKEVLGMNLCDLIDQAQHKKFLQQSLQHRYEVNDWEVAFITKEKEKKCCTLTVSAKDNENKGYVQGIIHDITSLKKIEKANLQGEKLAAAGRLVRTIAHEVRNPLNNITLSIEQMQHDAKDDSMALYMNIIQRNSKRINDLISELLYTSRPAENTLEKQALQTILDDVISICLDRLTLKHIQLYVNYPDNMIAILADREKLKLALLNILINAIEAMEENVGLLSIILHENETHAVLTIKDNGCGISEENISRLFEPYFTQKRNGVGLGLTFTLNILQAHKANIEVNSKPGQGTTFTISFPLFQEN
ncbi:MAG: PAS domain S-box protein [Taibaiella sp.]|nr:PAS domain S-box protein [Taibaiella sp.]